TAENITHLSVDLNQTSDHFTLKTYADTFRECLLTDFYQASYAPPIYDAIMTQLCYTNLGKHKDLLCHNKSDTNLNDYGDGALWMRVHIICPSDPLATTPAMTSIASTSVASSISSEATSVAPQSTQTSLNSITIQSSTQQIVETSTSNDTQSLCPISCHVRCSPNTNISIEIKVYKEQIRQELLVNTNSLSKTIRTKTSAPDPRPTARVTGGVAIAVVVVITVCLLSGDVVTLSCFIYLKFKGNSLLTMQ
ncbi:plasminogen, partial [Biomphalaria glabrata]